MRKWEKGLILTFSVRGLSCLTISAEYIEGNCKAFDEYDFCVGEHVWNFADFKTKRGMIRV